jgi:hypothetical protein
MRTRKAPRLAIVMTEILLMLLAATGCPVVKSTIADALEPLQDTVTTIIDEAALQANTLLITAAGQVALALGNFESAFAADLHRGVDQVDDATRTRLNQLTQLVADLQSGAEDLLTGAIDGSQQLMNTLPFTNKNPQVRAYTPRYVGPRSSTVVVEVQGNFAWAMQKGMAPTLTVADTTYRPVQSTTTRVGFEIPAGALAHSNGLATTSMELVAPYEKGRVIKSVRPGTFQLLIVTLPARPVAELTVVSTRDVVGRETHTITQPPNGTGWRVQSWGDCKYHKDSHAFSADAGWQIDPSTITVNYLSRGVPARGKATILNAQITGFTAVGETWPNCDPFGIASYDSGDITYEVQYTLSRTTHTDTNETLDLLASNPDLSWGDQVTAPVARDRWTVRARMWDGSVYQTSSANTSGNGALRVRAQGDSIEVIVTAPEDFR